MRLLKKVVKPIKVIKILILILKLHYCNTSNTQGGESQIATDEIQLIVLYLDSTTGDYRARFSDYTNSENKLGEYNSDSFFYPSQLKPELYSPMGCKLLKFTKEE